MLHKINPLGCVSQLEQILQFQRSVLVFACKLRSPVTLQPEDLENEFGAQIGQWLWNKLWVTRRSSKAQEPSNLQEALHRFAEQMSKHPTLGTSILAAFDHDIQFEKHLNSSKFTFSFNRLEVPVREVIRGLLELFYTDLLTSGFPQTIHRHKGTLNRSKLVGFFWDANSTLVVCPVCDRPRSPKVQGRIRSDADHFLPKSSYPFLSIHPFNLVPLCVDCNRTIKGYEDPIDDHGKAPLINTFHPYLNPAIDQVDIQTSRNAEGVRVIEIKDKVGMPSRRVASLNRVFKLEDAWIDGLEFSVSSIVFSIQEVSRYSRKRAIKIDLEEFKLDLKDMLKARHKKRGEQPFFVLHHSYLTFALEDEVELGCLFMKFNGYEI